MNDNENTNIYLPYTKAPRPILYAVLSPDQEDFLVHVPFWLNFGSHAERQSMPRETHVSSVKHLRTYTQYMRTKSDIKKYLTKKT